MSLIKPLYFDYAATTPTDPAVTHRMIHFLSNEGDFGNPASKTHSYGWAADEAVGDARHFVAELIGADAREIVFTSGATESNNLAIKGIAFNALTSGSRRRTLITLATEHKAVLDTMTYLSERGFKLIVIPVNPDGTIQMDKLEDALSDETLLVSVMHVNNETGVIQDIKKISEMVHRAGAIFHVDGAQSVGKIPVNVEELGIDLLSMSGHKMYGPKGIGALYVKRSPFIKLEAQIHGGGHERGRRSGTLATHQIVGLGEAAKLMASIMESNAKHASKIKQRFLDAFTPEDGVFVNGVTKQGSSIPNILNLEFSGVDGESLLMGLKDIAVSSGSACNSYDSSPSYVLMAMGKSEEEALRSIRFSYGHFTSLEDVEKCIEIMKSNLSRLKAA